MPHRITDACLACGTCVPECPVEAIAESDPIFIIDPDKCTDCGACVAVCPAEAIKPE
jgi:ferredoxin